MFAVFDEQLRFWRDIAAFDPSLRVVFDAAQTIFIGIKQGHSSIILEGADWRAGHHF
ncbi:MAG: hypothetical protein PHV34_09830 [Verrucomicrobiae bacterium]|nr:hypothetical protein [Verrucomicrobiae bacterium]